MPTPSRSRFGQRILNRDRKGSARLIQSCGAAAVATTSAGVAWAHGYPDGSALPTRILVAAVADIEAG